MKIIKIDEEKLDSIIEKLEIERNEYNKRSAEYIEKDDAILLLLNTIRDCKID